MFHGNLIIVVYLLIIFLSLILVHVDLINCSSPSPELGRSLPPSLRLVPSRSYTGRPIGTTYTVAVFPAPGAEEVKVETDRVLPEPVSPLVLQKVPSEFYPKVCNHGEGPY